MLLVSGEGLLHACISSKYVIPFALNVSGKLSLYSPRANGAKRRSGRKPGARVTNFVLAEFKVVARDR